MTLQWRLYADMQLRTTDFHYHGDVAIDPMRWTFFNPKLGARYDVSSSTGVSRRHVMTSVVMMRATGWSRSSGPLRR